MKTLFFDLDGTVIVLERGTVKPLLAAGAFERAIRRAGFQQLVCVGNAVALIAHLEEMGVEADGHQMIFDLCFGAFEDRSWFRGACSWITEPGDRGSIITGTGDWWYVDDLAQRYLDQAGKHALFESQSGGRILVPDANGDGQDVLDWLERIEPRQIP
jgi:phosphoserine phosphatase